MIDKKELIMWLSQHSRHNYITEFTDKQEFVQNQ